MTDQPWKLYGAQLAEVAERMKPGDWLAINCEDGRWHAEAGAGGGAAEGHHEHLDCALQQVAIGLEKRGVTK